MDRQAVQERFGIIGTSLAIQKVIDQTRLVARTDVSVLIQGESGVGKELIANAIHGLSVRKHRPLKVVNTGAIPEGLVESELFGAEKGAYTGASERRTGLFEAADGGTVFLDEIGEMPQAAQVRLLRVLESGAFNRVGSSTERTTDIRIIAATNKILDREVQAGRFREDLYYRLSTVIIEIPPLRERTQDILPIFHTFLYRLSQKYSTPSRRLDRGAQEILRHYRWPGNVRELRNVAEQVVVLHRGDTVSTNDIRPMLRGVTTDTSLLPVRHNTPEEPDTFRERELIYGALLDIRRSIRDLHKELATFATLNGPPGGADGFPHQQPPPAVGLLKQADKGNWENVITYEEVKADGDDSEDIPSLLEAERILIAKALRQFKGKRRQAAAALGISERTLYRKIKDMEQDGTRKADATGDRS